MELLVIACIWLGTFYLGGAVFYLLLELLDTRPLVKLGTWKYMMVCLRVCADDDHRLAPCDVLHSMESKLDIWNSGEEI